LFASFADAGQRLNFKIKLISAKVNAASENRAGKSIDRGEIADCFIVRGRMVIERRLTENLLQM